MPKLLGPDTNEIIRDEWMKVADPADLGGDSAWAQIIAQSLTTNSIVKDRMRHCARRGTWRDGQRLIRRYFFCEPVRVAALHGALRHRRVEIGQDTSWSHRRVVEVGRTLDVFSADHLPIRVGETEKKDGSPRVVYSLEVRDLARHRMAAFACEAVGAFHPRQFAVHGGDRAMKEWLRAALPKAQLVLTTDFPNFYLSLVRQRLTEVTALPRRVTQALLISPFDCLSEPGNQTPEGKEEMQAPKGWASKASRMGSLWLPALSGAMPISATCAGGLTEVGVPPGSPFSGIVSQAALRSVLEAIEGAAEGVQVGLVGDDLSIVLADANAKETVIHALMEAVRDVISDDAMAELRRRLVAHSPKRFNYVGYGIRLRGGRVKFTSRRRDWDLLEDRIYGEVANALTEVDGAYVSNLISARTARFEGDERTQRLAIAAAFRLGALASNPTAAKPATKGSASRVNIYTDGSASGCYGPGAWAFTYEADGKVVERAEHWPLTNNNEMELLAVVSALKACPDQGIKLHTDSRYVTENARHRLSKWKANAWRCTNGKPIAHRRLWKQLAAQIGGAGHRTLLGQGTLRRPG